MVLFTFSEHLGWFWHQALCFVFSLSFNHSKVDSLSPNLQIRKHKGSGIPPKATEEVTAGL